jgi:hypothetical protein
MVKGKIVALVQELCAVDLQVELGVHLGAKLWGGLHLD